MSNELPENRQPDKEIKPTVIIVTGATGIGKSKIIYELPTNSHVEIVNFDSRQVYQNFNIGTAMPSQQELKKFKHHLYGFLDPKERYSAGMFCKSAKQIIPEIIQRENTPILVGGTFFYIKALWDGLIEEPNISTSITEEIAGMSTEQAFKKLDEISGSSEEIKKISKNDDYRIRRALSVRMATGNPISELHKKGGIFKEYNFESYWIDSERPALYDKINTRTASMMESGLINEILNLIEAGFDQSTAAMKSIGYSEFWKICENNDLKPQNWQNKHTEELIEVVSQHSRNYAKRQLTWFRNEKRLKRIDLTRNNFLLSEKLK